MRFIAEIGSNHNRSMRRAMSLIQAAHDAGCTHVKFQVFTAERLYHESAVPQRESAKQAELPVSWLPTLARESWDRGLRFGVSVFDEESLETVMALVPDIDFLKIASYSLLDMRLVEAVAQTDCPMVVVGTGMATTPEITPVLAALDESHKEMVLLHCVSSYPVDARNCHLMALVDMKDRLVHFTVGVDTHLFFGWSDHSVDPAVIYRAAFGFGASVIEMHMDLEDRGGLEGGGHCWTAPQMAEVIATVRRGFEADGQRFKYPHGAEAEELKWRADPTDGLRPRLEYR